MQVTTEPEVEALTIATATAAPESQHVRLVVDNLPEDRQPRSAVQVPWNRSLNIPWCDSPFLEQQIAAEQMPAELAAIARRYARDGYVIIDPEFAPGLIEGTIQDMNGRYRDGGGGAYSSPGRIQDSWQFSDHSRRIASDPKVLDLLYFLYRRQPVPFQTLNFPLGTQQRTHSDTIHFHCFPHHFMCGVWVALEDIDLTNGPLHYYPGSQRLPLYDMHDLGISASQQSNPYEHYVLYEDFIESIAKSKGLRRTELQVKKGQALVWSANLFHGGSPILDPSRSRHTQVTHYYFTDCVYTTPLMSDFRGGKAFLREPMNIKNGRAVTGRYNGTTVHAAKWPFDLAASAADPTTKLEPIALGTVKEQRIVAWPRWDDATDVDRIVGEFGAVLAGCEDACLCLRFDAVTDRPFEDALQLLVNACTQHLDDKALDILVIDDDLAQIEWPRIGLAVTGAIAAGGPRPSAQRDFIAALGVPVAETAAELRHQLSGPRRESRLDRR